MNFANEGKGDTVQFIVGGISTDNCTIVTFHLRIKVSEHTHGDAFKRRLAYNITAEF